MFVLEQNSLTKPLFMKKFFLFIGIISLSLITHAQLAIKAGMNVSTFTGNDAEGAKSLTGFYVGAHYNLPINGKFSFQPEAVYSAEGAKDETDAKFKIGYINVSPIFRYNASGFFVGTGPQIGFLMSAKAEYQGQSMDMKDAMKSTNFSWAFLAGYEMSNGLGISARYNLGLSSIADDSNADLKTSVFQFGVHYTFKMGGSTASK
jgi:outer membrane protein with beta-barrel domain